MNALRKWVRQFGRWLIDMGTEADKEPYAFVAPNVADMPSFGRHKNQMLPILDSVLLNQFSRVGLPIGHYSDNFDVMRTGKLHELIDGASHQLDIDNPLRTVGDIKALLSRSIG